MLPGAVVEAMEEVVETADRRRAFDAAILFFVAEAGEDLQDGVGAEQLAKCVKRGGAHQHRQQQTTQDQQRVPWLAAVGAARAAGHQQRAAGLQVEVPERQERFGVGREKGVDRLGIAELGECVADVVAICGVGRGDRLILHKSTIVGPAKLLVQSMISLAFSCARPPGLCG
jgi:hypothetical protein